MTWDRIPWRHLGMPVVVVLAVCLTQLIVGLAAYWQYSSLIHAMRANVDRQERIRDGQFAEVRAQISQDMADQSAASDAAVQRVMSDWFSAAGNRMAAVSDRREKALRLIGTRLGVPTAELDAIFSEPLPPYPTTAPTHVEPEPK